MRPRKQRGSKVRLDSYMRKVVRGKGTTRCLWHACKALGLGLFFMLLGACMATIGYYADQLSVAQEIRGNLTIKVKNKSREYHLNNLSYAGPIVMGVGGFIVVAACVMTFETRDSAAKVVPARFRLNQMSTLRNVKNQRNRRSTSSQTMKWDHQLGLFRVNRSPSPSTHETSRKQLKAEFIRFSKDLHDKGASHCIKKSPSAPTLIDKKSPRKETPRYAGCALLNPELLQRHALSVDNPAYSPPQVSRESLLYQKMTGSQASMTMDLHIPNKAPITLRVKDRSDTAKRHQLLRQTKVEDTEDIHETRRHIVNYVYSSRLPDVTMGQRKTSLEFRRSPDFRAGTYRKLSVDRYSVDCSRYFLDGMEFRSRTSSGENLKRTRYSKLHHSRSDDNRRRSFDRCQRESQSSRYSLNTQVTGESVGLDYEGKYFTGSSVETEESRTDNNPDDSLVLDLDDPTTSALSPVDGLIEADTLLEEPELENLTEVESETCCETTVQLSATIEATDEGSNAARNAEKDQARIRENETILRQTDASDVILYVEDDEV